MKLYNISVLGLAALVAGESTDGSSTMVNLSGLEVDNPTDLSSMDILSRIKRGTPLSAKQQEKKEKREMKENRKKANDASQTAVRLAKEKRKNANDASKSADRLAKQKRKADRAAKKNKKCDDAPVDSPADTFNRLVEAGGFKKFDECVAYKINASSFLSTYYQGWQSCKDDTEGQGSLAEFHSIEEYNFMMNYYMTDAEVKKILDSTNDCWVWTGATPIYHAQITTTETIRQLAWRWQDGSAVIDALGLMTMQNIFMTNKYDGKALDFGIVMGDHKNDRTFDLSSGSAAKTGYNGYACEIRSRAPSCRKEINTPRCSSQYIDQEVGKCGTQSNGQPVVIGRLYPGDDTLDKQ